MTSIKNISLKYDKHFWAGMVGLLIGYGGLFWYASSLCFGLPTWGWLYWIIILSAILNIVGILGYLLDKKQLGRLRKTANKKAVSDQASIYVARGRPDQIIQTLLGLTMLSQGFVMFGVSLLSATLYGALTHRLLVDIMRSPGFAIAMFTNTLKDALSKTNKAVVEKIVEDEKN